MKDTFYDDRDPFVEMRGGALHYQMSQPIDISINTSHPEDLEQSLIISFLSPRTKYTSTLPLSAPMHPIYRKELHQHDYYELIYVRQGSMYQKIEDRRHLYSRGSLCLLNHHVRHAEEYQTDFQCAFVALSDPLMKELLPNPSSCYFQEENRPGYETIRDMVAHGAESGKSQREYIDFIPCPGSEEEVEAMHDRFEALCECILAPGPGATFRIKAILAEIFGALTQTSLYDTIPINIGSEKEGHLFDDINRIMEARYGRVSRSELAEMLNYDGSYINLVVRKYTGMSIFAYGNSLCMKEAARLLRETSRSVQTIADELLFSNRTHFYKLFEEYWHMTPRQYRQQFTGRSRESHER